MRFASSSLLLACSLLAVACGSSADDPVSTEEPTEPRAPIAQPHEESPPRRAGAEAPDTSDVGLPGKPSTGGVAPVVVTINGRVRTFEGEATASKSYVDGHAVVGFQTNARDGKDWTLVLSVFGKEPGTYSCKDARAGLYLSSQFKDDGGFDPTAVDYGGSAQTQDCSITIASYGSHKGDHIKGSFKGALVLSNGAAKATVGALTLTNGAFDLVQSADAPE